MLAHCPENPILSHENFRSIEFGKIPVVHHTCTIVRDDGPYPVYHPFSQELRRDRVLIT